MSRTMGGILVDSFVAKWTTTLPITKVDLSGRTVIITGANGGLGFEAAKHFYSMNPARLVLAVRTISKGEEAKEAIVNSAKEGEGKKTSVEVWELDMASFEGVKRFAARVNRELERVDVFLANAGTQTREFRSTADGWESTLQVNVLSTFLLATLVVPILKKTAKLPPPVKDVHLRPHLTIVASDTHETAAFPERSADHIINTLNDKSKFLASDRYRLTKLLDVFLTRELSKSEEFKGGDVVVCCVNPGFCRSELMREMPAPVRGVLYGLFARTTEEGSRTFLWASLADDIPLGSYTSSCQVIKPDPYVESAEGQQAQKQLWNETADILVKIAPETAPVWNVNN